LGRRLLPVTSLFALLLVAGCGLSQVQPKSSSNAPSTVPTQPPVATTAPAPTLVVQGGAVAATVNGHPISMTDFKRFLTLNQRLAALNQTPESASQLAQGAMSQVVQNELIREYAAAHGLKATASAVKKQVNADISQMQGRKAAQARLKQLGLTTADLHYLATVEVLTTLVERKLTPVGPSGPIAHVRHILISAGSNPGVKKSLTDAQAHALAVQLLDRIQHGANFAKLAKKYSTDTSSGANGGDLGTVYHLQMVPPFDQAAFHAPLHKAILVHSSFGYHIVEVLSRGTGPYPASTVQQIQQSALSTWLQQQRAHAKIHQIVKVK
jgi:parvulin-like peptidyl-prolyl isomerase